MFRVSRANAIIPGLNPPRPGQELRPKPQLPTRDGTGLPYTPSMALPLSTMTLLVLKQAVSSSRLLFPKVFKRLFLLIIQVTAQMSTPQAFPQMVTRVLSPPLTIISTFFMAPSTRKWRYIMFERDLSVSPSSIKKLYERGTWSTYPPGHTQSLE